MPNPNPYTFAHVSFGLYTLFGNHLSDVSAIGKIINVGKYGQIFTPAIFNSNSNHSFITKSVSMYELAYNVKCAALSLSMFQLLPA